MKVRNNVEVIDLPSLEEFKEKYLYGYKPVIIRGVFNGQPIEDINTEDKAVEAFGDMRVLPVREYIKNLTDGLAMFCQGNLSPEQIQQALYPSEKELKEKFECSFQEYMALVRSQPDTDLIVTESQMQPELTASRTWPDLCYAWDDEPKEFVFIANQGNCSSMHFDRDLRPVFLYQVFGKKRAVMVHPKQGKKLNPVDVYASTFLNNFSEEDKAAFIQYLDAWDCIIEPGETLFMPPLIWHHLEYVETGMSFNIRMGKNNASREFRQIVRHEDMYTQNLGIRMINEHEVAEKHAAWLAELRDVSNKAYPTGRDRYLAMHDKCMELYHRVCDDAIQPQYSFTNFDMLRDMIPAFWIGYASREELAAMGMG